MDDRTWRKSSYSGGQGNCVEVGTGQSGVVAVRDSKERYGKIITLSDRAWSAFVQGVKRGEFDEGNRI